MSEGVGTGFARWSQRKLAARRNGVPAIADDEPASEIRPDDELPSLAHAQRELAVETPDAEPHTETGSDATPAGEDMPVLPSIDELDAQSDYTAFLAKGVPEALTRAALRKLWLSDPVLANIDGLNNYDEDYNVVDQLITAAQTSYRPGLGYLDEIESELAKLDDAIPDVGGERARSPRDPALDDGDAADATGRSDASADEAADAPPQLDIADHDIADQNNAAVEPAIDAGSPQRFTHSQAWQSDARAPVED